MRKTIKRAASLVVQSKDAIRADGVVGFARRAHKKVYYKLNPHEKPRHMRDVLFIVGPHLPQVKRYRVDHQVEQLNANGMTADIVFDNALSLEKIKYYRGFVFCRYPHTDFAEEFIRVAKSFNKTIFFEIDDLVFDRNFTDNIKTVQDMSAEDRELYDSGVMRCQKTLRLCDYAITTTEPLAAELKKYNNLQDVFINRNVASDAMVATANNTLEKVIRSNDTVTIGYFSGSITHNDDFDMVTPTLANLLRKYPQVRLHIGGILDQQSELLDFADRITTVGFVEWSKLFDDVRKCDINIAPLAQKTIFNESKSEIKWLDAALVKTVTVASDFGAFHTEINDGVTGVLVADDDRWFDKLEEMVLDSGKRDAIAKNAYDEVTNCRTTISTGKRFADWVEQKLSKNIVFVIPSSEISGGVNVVLKHADILREHGFDVTLINAVSRRMHTAGSRKLDGYNEVFAYNTVVEQRIHELVATLWATVPYVRKIETAKTKSYFVQNFETNFLRPGDRSRLIANSTYCYNDLKYTTMSLWCKQWLKDNYGQDALYASNGLWTERYTYTKREFKNRKIRILIEGDPQSEWKNVDEAFRIANKLDKDRFEINFLSYYAEPKKWYQVDNFHQKVPSEEVGKIYGHNDILLKTSLLESFSYPPLEMVATGGFVVVIPNGGNLEYLKNEENCLMFESGEDEKAIAQIERIVSDDQLRNTLEKNGKKLVQDYSWGAVEEQIIRMYE